MKKDLITAAAEAQEVYDADELEAYAEEFRACPIDGGEGEPLGTLGRKMHFCCRSCGMQFSKDI